MVIVGVATVPTPISIRAIRFLDVPLYDVKFPPITNLPSKGIMMLLTTPLTPDPGLNPLS